MVSSRINRISSMNLDDLSDTCELCDCIDTVEDFLDGGEESEAKEFVNNTIDLQFVQNHICS
jgi:hypothetical protein